jgi:CDP-glucose 4,6-dehydratase
MLVAKVGRGEWQSHYEEDAPGEAVHLSLNIEKADRELDWRPVWDFEEAVSATVDWYERYLTSPSSAIEFTQDQIRSYVVDAQDRGLSWAVSDGTGVAT